MGAAGIMLAACKDCSGCKVLIPLLLPRVVGWGALEAGLLHKHHEIRTSHSDKTSRTAVGVGETVPLDALSLEMFGMTGFLQVFSVSCPCFWSGPLPVMCRCQKVSVAMLFVLWSNWLKLLLSMCNIIANPEPQRCTFLTVWPFSSGQGGGKDLESLQWWSIFPAKQAHTPSSIWEGHKLSCHMTALPALHTVIVSMRVTRSWKPVSGEALRQTVARKWQPVP